MAAVVGPCVDLDRAGLREEQGDRQKSRRVGRGQAHGLGLPRLEPQEVAEPLSVGVPYFLGQGARAERAQDRDDHQPTESDHRSSFLPARGTEPVDLPHLQHRLPKELGNGKWILTISGR